jgi:hypothetical protein
VSSPFTQKIFFPGTKITDQPEAFLNFTAQELFHCLVHPSRITSEEDDS